MIVRIKGSPVNIKLNFAHQHPEAARIIAECIVEGKQFVIHEKNTDGQIWDSVKLASFDRHTRVATKYEDLDHFLYGLGWAFSIALITRVEPVNKKVENGTTAKGISGADDTLQHQLPTENEAHRLEAGTTDK